MNQAVIIDLSKLSLRTSRPGSPPQLRTRPSNVFEGKPQVFLQERCYGHRYIRSRDLSAIVERPERLRAIALGLSAAIARLEDEATALASNGQPTINSFSSDGDQLTRALSQLEISGGSPTLPCAIIHSNAHVDLLSHPATLFVHANPQYQAGSPSMYLPALKDWATRSEDNVAKGESEIPTNLPQGDLYCMSRNPILDGDSRL